jgi:quaternary ammonium compound-resistance protein SugE
MMSHWLILIVAGLFEIGFAACMGKARESVGLTAHLWWLGFVLCLSASMFLLYRATQTIPIGTAYGIWTGIGAVGTVIMGIVLFREPADFWRIFFITTLIVSIVGLKYIASN